MAVKKSIIVKCDGDGCKNYIEVPSESTHPADWFRIYDYRDAKDNVHFDLCSLKCVERWAKGRRAVIPALGNHPCGMCDFVATSLQGLREHERSAHGLRIVTEAV